MKEPEKRILVVLDASEGNLQALDAAVQLAAREHAELIGMFLVDVNLIRMTELPFVREIRFPSATESRMDLLRLERELKVRTEKLLKTFADLADHARVRWSFRSVRGHITTELVSAASTANFLLLAGRSLRLREAEIRRCLEENSCNAIVIL